MPRLGPGVSIAGVAIDKWKLKIFRRVLTEAGYEYTQHPGVTKGTLMLQVKYDNIEALAPVIKKANEAAARSKRH